MRAFGALCRVGLSALAVGAGCRAEPPPVQLELGVPFARQLAVQVCAPQKCPADDWSVLGHDSTRSNASAGCCGAPLTLEFRFEPPGQLRRPARVHHVVSHQGVFYASGTIGNSPAVFAVDSTGTLRWTFDSRVDITRHHWPAVVLDRVVLNDDGLYILERESGRKEVDRGLDSWGEVLSDGRNLFANNTWYIAGPQLYVGALESGGAPLWTRNRFGVVREDTLDRAGGIALASGMLWQTLDTRPNDSVGVFAFRADDGKPQWSTQSIPLSGVSTSGDRVYVLERSNKGAAEQLVSRTHSTGEVRFAVPLAEAEDRAPTLAQGSVLVRSRRGALSAFDDRSGEMLWQRATPELPRLVVARSTSFAVALGSRSILVAGGTELTLLHLSDGRELWRGRPSAARGVLHSPIFSRGRVILADDTGFLVLRCGP